MDHFGSLNWAIIGFYLIANLILGWAMSSKVKTADDYYVGDRSTPWWAIGISVVATYVSALSFLGGPAWAYGDGMAALIIHVNYPLVILIVITLFLPFFYNSGVPSIYSYLEERFGRASRAAMGFLFLITQSITSASILTATAVVVTYITGLDPKIVIVIMAAIVLVYTLMGGMNAVIWTDVLQGVTHFVGAGLILYFLVGSVSPLEGALDYLASQDKLDPLDTRLDFSVAPTVWAGVFAMTLFHITVYGGNQMMVQRTLAARSIGDAKKSYLLMGYASFPIYFLFFFIGALMFVHFKGRPFEQTNEIILVFAQALEIPGLMGILAAAIMSASMSSLSSGLNSLATITVTDFYKPYIHKSGDVRHYLTASRFATVAWSLIIIPGAFLFIDSKGSILENLTAMTSYFVGAKLALFGMGFLSKHTSERGILVGIAGGFIAIYVLKIGIPFTNWTPPPIAWPWFVVIGSVGNIVVAWSASLVLDGPKKEWHTYSIPGQVKKFRKQNLEEKQNGWYRIPGRIDPASYGLLIMFAAIMIFMAWFSTLA